MNQRQDAFQRLRPSCVELSSTALKFKANQVSPKAVLLALEPVHEALSSLAQHDLLDEKLAEYAFFPLTHILNQSRRLPSQILELTVKAVAILVDKGWRDKLVPELGKQLLILMSLLVSPSSHATGNPPSDELKVSAFECISSVLHQTAGSENAANVLTDVKSRSIVDQLAYQLLEEMSTTVTEAIQLAAAHAMLELQGALLDPITLASLLPRTVSTLVKVLRPSTQVRRTQNVLANYLRLLTEVLRRVLSNGVLLFTTKQPTRSDAAVTQSDDEPGKLDRSWLDATAPQIDVALVQVVKLRVQPSAAISKALLGLCLVVIEDCSESLHSSLPLMVETLVVLCRSAASSSASAALSHLMVSRPEISEIVNTKFYAWSQALPRIMQGNDDRPKQQMLGQLATSFHALTNNTTASDDATQQIASVLVDSVTAALEVDSAERNGIMGTRSITYHELTQPTRLSKNEFEPILLRHQSQKLSTDELRNLIISLRSNPGSSNIVRSLIGQSSAADTNRRLAAAWLALTFLQSQNQTFEIADWLQEDSASGDISLTRPFLVSDLYSQVLPNLLQSTDDLDGAEADWRLTALALECLVLQADQLGELYRDELMDTLFPILTLLSSPSTEVQQHAITTLNLLANACRYDSAAEMLIGNVDYLINAIALRLNSFDVSQDGLQVLAMMIRLCGADLLPHLDDVIGSIFGALDSYHGYPKLVEHLFSVLGLIVDESSRKPTRLAIKQGVRLAINEQQFPPASALDDIVLDLQARQSRKIKNDAEHEALTSAPHKPWKDSEDLQDPSSNEEDVDAESHDEYISPESGTQEKGPVLSTPHKLLIRIAEATVPHMSSPSAKARQTLLEILRKITPVLAADENSFLPLVNAIWPALVSRILIRKGEEHQEKHYNIQAAIDTIKVICDNAGNFMASRIDEILSDLEEIFTTSLAPSTSISKAYSTANPIGSEAPFRWSERAYPSGVAQNGGGSTSSLQHRSNKPSNMQLLHSLSTLFGSILQSVRISEDNADKIFTMLASFVHGRQSGLLQDIMVQYNSDLVWLIERG